MTTKICKDCKAEKSLEEFGVDHHSRDGRTHRCIVCTREFGKNRAERFANECPDSKKCPCCGVEKPLDAFYTSRHAATGRNSHCKECIRENSRRRYKEDPAFRRKLLEKRAAYYHRNPDKSAASKKKWQEKNPEKAKESIRKRNEKRVATPKGMLEERVRAMIKVVIKNGKDRVSWRETLGYSFEDLKRHIENQFQPGMTWELVVSRKIEIDHIIPRCAFYYETSSDPDFRACWVLENLRPLWRKDNRAKGHAMPDGSDGREVGHKRQEEYEARLACMAAGGNELELISA